MKHLLPLLLLLAACGRGDPQADNRSESSVGNVAAESAPSSKEAARPARLTGLYEGGAGAQKNQLCLIEKGGETEFGLIVWGGSLHSCSGAGLVQRSGERLTLRMTGDETCTIEASLKSGTIALPATLPRGCAYYCGASASLAGATFTRSGSTEAAAKKATDIAGDPLCD